MKKNSPISVDYTQFYSYEINGKDDLVGIDQFPYDNRRDFIFDETFGGIAIHIKVSNESYDKGVRRELLLLVVDASTRCEVTCRRIKVNMRSEDYCKDYYMDFPAKMTEFKPGHTYKLIISDATASQTLATSVFHLFNSNKLGHPTKWYEVCDGGIRPAWEQNLYKNLKTIDNHDYYVRFNLSQKFGSMPPSILPELELRLYYPDGHYISTQFKEPRCLSVDNFDNNYWFVEYLFIPVQDISGVFYAELLCMEYPIAGLVFDTNREDERGSWFGDDISPLEEYSLESATKRLNDNISDSTNKDNHLIEEDFDELLDDFINSQKKDSISNEDDTSYATTQETTDDKQQKTIWSNNLIPKLENLTGLKQVKEKLRIYERIVMFNKMRSDRGLPTTTLPLHAMFLGSPGTGKTTVARMIGLMLRRAGVLSKGHVVVRERANLLGQFYHSEAEKTLAAIEEAQGGILLIDEAYQLYQPNDPRDPGKFVIETLMTALADTSKRDWMLILAGYPKETQLMFDMNPGLKSRIPESNIYIFEDFNENELIEIAEKYFERNSYKLSSDAHTALVDRLRNDYSHRDKSFGNARHVINMIQTEIIPAMALRVTDACDLSANSLTEILSTDIPHPYMQTNSSRPRIGFSI